MFFRFIGYIFGMGTLAAILIVGGVAWYVQDLSKDLPSEQGLNAYEPPVTTRVYATDGSLMAEYARERRLYLPIQAIPDMVKNAETGALVDPEDTRALIGAIREILVDPHRRRATAARARAFAETCDWPSETQGLVGQYERTIEQLATARGIRKRTWQRRRLGA